MRDVGRVAGSAMILLLLLVLCPAYLVFAVVSSRRAAKRPGAVAGFGHHLLLLLVGGAAPVLTAVCMADIFLVSGAATTVQFNAGGDVQMSAWSRWVGMFPVLLFACGSSAVGSFGWLVFAVAKKSMRDRAVAAAFSLVLSVVAFFAVGTNFPTA